MRPSEADSVHRLDKRQSTASSDEHEATVDTAETEQSVALTMPLIKQYEREAVASRQHLNHITALLAHVEAEQQSVESSSASLHTVTAAYQSLYRILTHYAESGELPLSTAATDTSQRALTRQLRGWLQAHYKRYVACSLTFIHHRHLPLQLSSLHSLMSLVRLSTDSLPADAVSSVLASGVYASLVSAALDSPSYDAIHDTLTAQYLLPYVDLRVVALRAIKATCRQLALHSSNATTDSERTLHNTLTLLLQLSTPDTPAPNASFTAATLSSSAVGSSLNGAYMAFLSVSHTPSTYKRLLEHLHSHILPHVSNPLLLADFLTDSYHIGGIVSLLALASLFHLIAHYNLDYPHFYHKLYSLCTPALTLSKHRTQFFVLLAKFLSSAYLPSTLVAAFCKRLTRLAVAGGGGVDGSMELMRIVWGLIRRNRAVSAMVWQVQEAEKDKEMAQESLTDFLLKRQAQLATESDTRKDDTAAGPDGSGLVGAGEDIFDDTLSDDDEHKADTSHVNHSNGRSDPLTAIQSSAVSQTTTPAAPPSSFTRDPFSPLVDDPAACDATASTLWELRTLTYHYAPAVRSLAALFYAANAPKGEVDAVGVGKVGDSEGYEGMMKREMERRKNQKVAANFASEQHCSKKATL